MSASNAKFTPSAAATTYEAVQSEAFEFYSRTARSSGVASRLAAQAARRWEQQQANQSAA